MVVGGLSLLVAFAFWNRYHPANTETSVFSLKRKCSIVAFHNMTYIQKTIAQTTTTDAAESLLIFSEDRNIFHAVPRALKISILCLLRRSFYTISDIEIQFLRKLRTVKTVLFLAAKKACKYARRSFHNADPTACRLPVNHSFEPLPTEVCAIPGPFRLWPAFQSR